MIRESSPPSRGAWIEIHQKSYLDRPNVAPLAGGVD